MLGGDIDEGVAFIIPEADVVAGLKAFDELAFEQQRFAFGVRGVDNDAANPVHHGLLFGGGASAGKIARNAFFKVFGLTHVDDFTLIIQHPINPGLMGQ